MKHEKTADPLTDAIRVLTSFPEDPDRVFLLPDVTYGHVYAMAAELRPALAEAKGPACLFAEDRAVMAAALIAALDASQPLILPHAVSTAALEQIRRQCGITLAVMDAERALPEGVDRVVPNRPAAAGTDAGPVGEAPEPDKVWVRLFTGGSTGRPQIWSKTVGNLLGEAAYQAGSFGYGPGDRIVATVPGFHIYGLLYSLLAPLIAAASVASETPSYPREVKAVCDACRATILVSVPVHYRAMKETGVFCRPLRVALSSAGPLDPTDAEAFFSHTATGVTEIYGSTETGGIAARCRAAGQQALYPFSVVDWKITDRRLHVRSNFLSPELPLDAAGFFKTGDRAAEAKEGGFVLLGREDGVVKVGGKRVDTEEIRERMRSFSGVRDAVVAVLPAKAGRRTALGALVEGSVDPAELRRHLADRLEPHALPRLFRVVEKIPVTAAGKVDRERVLALLVG